ncbi:Nif3-related protein [Spironucleus salmonicida]|uniref:Nif3-related protein n=1 Tax=Spironucleus salmonicida TaxID=348837 RepID=V6LT29_9EUKA|nr:Nif3-related protein [Spironucleus salmonicida]|eukprot:EST47413.1 Nif3-related protein [Spironucleus salmonicida]
MHPQDLLKKISPWFPHFDDFTINGLQLEGDRLIRSILFSVSISEHLIDYAIANNFDAIFVHHGYFGKKFFCFQRTEASKLRKLCRAGISVFAYHLPLDGQEEFGHNAVISREIGLTDCVRQSCGFVGKNSLKLTCTQIAEKLNTFFGEENYKITVTSESKFGPKSIGNSLLWQSQEVPEKIFVCSGGSGNAAESVFGDCQLFILGEISEYHPINSLENGLGLLVLGHWRSEQAGIWAIQKKFDEMDFKTEYLKVENVI